MATRTRPQPESASHGSRTMTITADEAQPDRSSEPEAGPSNPILRLRGGPSRSGPRVQWDDEVIDNEGMGKKKSKICCIYHKPKAFDESSSSGSSSDSSGEEEPSEPPEGQEKCGHKHHKRRTKKAKGSNTVTLQKDPGSNAYEQQPKPPGKGKDAQ